MSKSSENTKLIDIEKVFADKNPALLKIIPGFFIRYLKKILHQDEINEFLQLNSEITGIPLVRKILKELTPADVSQNGIENIPSHGRYMFIANHPLGGLDGLAFILAASEKFNNIKFPVNDILLNIEGLSELFIPINKHGSHSREAAQKLEEAINSDSQILYFPAGMVSRKIKGNIIDLEWKKTFLKKAIQSGRDIVPVHISGNNSNFFYNLANYRKRLGIKLNLEMLYLADEMFNYKAKKIVINFGTPIPINSIKTNPDKLNWVQEIRKQTYLLAK
ncbi:MAG: 1-acyl-sn-glycerol-3-phosphate acyltransferase [Marinilabiliaceae bacterium]|nr:1-acyl-sn-glycerol-3-phosphate acyltransferase [Marinilabiliaceae bacterium]